MEIFVIGIIALVAFAAVLVPLFRHSSSVTDAHEFDMGADPEHTPIVPVSAGPVTAVSPPPIEPVDFGTHVPDDVEAEVLRYRRALRAGTICRKCGEANPEGSVYCADCGSKLPLEDAREFD